MIAGVSRAAAIPEADVKKTVGTEFKISAIVVGLRLDHGQQVAL
jgi:hypothetical protein